MLRSKKEKKEKENSEKNDVIEEIILLYGGESYEYSPCSRCPLRGYCGR